jgi:hypothetical protein
MGKRDRYLLTKPYKKTFPAAKIVHSHVLPVASEGLARASSATNAGIAWASSNLETYHPPRHG